MCNYLSLHKTLKSNLSSYFQECYWKVRNIMMTGHANQQTLITCSVNTIKIRGQEDHQDFYRYFAFWKTTLKKKFQSGLTRRLRTKLISQIQHTNLSYQPQSFSFTFHLIILFPSTFFTFSKIFQSLNSHVQQISHFSHLKLSWHRLHLTVLHLLLLMIEIHVYLHDGTAFRWWYISFSTHGAQFFSQIATTKNDWK